MTQMVRTVLIGAILAFAIGNALSSWACDAMGKDRHVGVVTQIDREAGTFTIIDAQMQKPMTFQAGKAILDDLTLNRDFIITFKMDGKQMIAKAAAPAS